MGKHGVGLGHLFLWCGFDSCAQAKAQTIAHLGHRTGRGDVLLAIALGSQGFQSRVGWQPGRGQRCPKGRSLLGMGFGQPPEGFSRLWVLRFPTLTTTAGRLRPETPDARASRGKPHGKSPAPPTQDRFGQEGVASTVLHGPLGLTGAPFRPGHLGGCQA
jgi:hypothetical protein